MQIFCQLVLGVIGLGTLLLLFSNANNISIQYFFQPTRWKFVLIYILKHILNYLGDDSIYLEEYLLVQYAYRTAACYNTCINNPTGQCTECGCDTVGAINVKEYKCSGNRWGMFWTKEEYEMIKRDFDITLTASIKPKNKSI